jgi:tetratricopeptide (TPR) repeat protein
VAAIDWRKHLRPLLGLWVLALLAYSNSFRSGFALDSATVILGDSRVRAATGENLHLIRTQEYWYNTATTGLYRPATTLSYLFNYAVLGNGNRPAGYHWVNFALHALNILLVYVLGLLVFRNPAAAVALAALWGVHPALTESVTNLVGRADLLAGFGVLAGLVCYIQSVSATGRRRLMWLAGVAMATALGAFSKESGVVAIAAIAIYDLAFVKAPWRERLPGYAAAAVPILLFLYQRGQVLANLPLGLVPFGDNPLTGADFFTSRMTAVKVIGKYLWLLVFPLRLSSDYSYHQIPLFTWGDWEAWAALAVCAAAVAAAIYSFRRNRTIFFFVAFFFATLAPASNVAMRIGTIMAERFLYLPAIGLLGCLVWALFRIPRRQAVYGALAVAVVLLAGRTWARNLDWYDDSTLWASAEKASPGSFKVHAILADQWQQKEGGIDRAVAESDRALAILDGLADERNTVRPYAIAGSAYRRKGDAGGGKSWYRKAAAALEHGVRVDRATLELIRRENAAEGRTVLPSGWPPLYLELGRVRLRMGEPGQALEALDYGRIIRPDPQFFEERSAAYRALGDFRQAAIALLEGFAIDPSQTQFANEVADLYRQTEPGSCAIRTQGGTSTLDLECPLVHEEVCEASKNAAVLHQKRGKSELAAGTRLSAIRDLGCPASMF